MIEKNCPLQKFILYSIVIIIYLGDTLSNSGSIINTNCFKLSIVHKQGEGIGKMKPWSAHTKFVFPFNHLVNNNILGSLSESKICAEAIRAFFTCNDWIICRYTTRDKWGSGN